MLWAEVRVFLNPTRDISQGYRDQVMTPDLECVFKVVDTSKKLASCWEKLHKFPNLWCEVTAGGGGVLCSVRHDRPDAAPVTILKTFLICQERLISSYEGFVTQCSSAATCFINNEAAWKGKAVNHCNACMFSVILLTWLKLMKDQISVIIHAKTNIRV